MLTSNIHGTMADRFRIGKRGPTILQGTEPPTGDIGSSGDVYIMHGSAPRLYQKSGIAWFWSHDPQFAFVRQTVQAGQALAVEADTTHVSVTASADPGETTVTLPSGAMGMSIVVKDEAGIADQHAIVVQGATGQTIDGSDQRQITTNRGFLTLVFTTFWQVTGSA